MKRLTVLFILEIFCLNTRAQEEAGLTLGKFQIQNQIGFNASNFIKTYLTFNTYTSSTNTSIPVFNLTYKVLFKDVILPSNFKFGLRAGFTYLNNETNNGTDSTWNNSKNNTFAWRIGLEVQQAISKRFVVFYGIDYFQNKTTTESENRSVYNTYPASYPTIFYTQSGKSPNSFYGVGPLIGIQFNINKYLSLSTETVLYFIHSTNSATYDYTRSDGLPYTGYKQQTTTGSTKQAIIALPTFINLNFMF